MLTLNKFNTLLELARAGADLNTRNHRSMAPVTMAVEFNKLDIFLSLALLGAGPVLCQQFGPDIPSLSRSFWRSRASPGYTAGKDLHCRRQPT